LRDEPRADFGCSLLAVWLQSNAHLLACDNALFRVLPALRLACSRAPRRGGCCRRNARRPSAAITSPFSIRPRPRRRTTPPLTTRRRTHTRPRERRVTVRTAPARLRKEAPAPAPVPPSTVQVKEFVRSASDSPDADPRSAFACDFSFDRPISRPSSVFHPPRL